MARRKEEEEATEVLKATSATTPAKKKAPRKTTKKEKETIDPLSVKGLFGSKLMDAGVDKEGWSILYFSNGHELKIKGDVFLVVKETSKRNK